MYVILRSKKIGIFKRKKDFTSYIPLCHIHCFESKDEPTQMTSSRLQLYTLLHTRKLYTLNSYAKMFTVEDSIFPNTWIQFSNPKLKLT